MYGPSVFPYQPAGIWLSPWNGAEWVQSSGENQYRRALYTYWKRSAAYPSMLTFDGVSREVCTVRRIRTNTPLQALTTLNDSAYIDLARNLAVRMQTEGGNNTAAQINKGYQLATYKNIPANSLQALLKLYNNALVTFKNEPKKAMDFLDKNETDLAHPEMAALAVVANAILNLDELLMKN